MTSYRLCCVFLLIVQAFTIYGDDVQKSSLTFVIDDTGSMYNEIAQVKEEANKIFDTVLNSNASQIENFVLVTFNDPDAVLRTVTKDQYEFKSALASIRIHGGDDCPEYAMKGITLGLENSLPQSYLYVFTDASAKDYAKFDEIKSISQKKQSQVVFVLTGVCGDETNADYRVYHKVAQATNGQVFHMMKQDVKVILKYVEETIKGRGTVLVNKKLSPGYGKKITYPVDSKSGPVLISVTGRHPKIGEVTGPGGSKPKTEPISEADRMVIVKVTDAESGDHEVEVGSTSETHVVISAKTTIDFQLGFSTFKPGSIKDTATRPAPDGNSFLSIKVIGEGVKLNSARVLDLSDNVIIELPLELADEKEQFYVAPAFDPPTTMFRVSVSGIDVKSKTPITRKSPTPVQRQDPSTEKKDNVAPQVTIYGEPKIITEFNEPLQLKCKVHAYPKPDIIWEEKDTGIHLPAAVSLIEVPYDYISILDIAKANKNNTYQCKASNRHGLNVKYIEVETKRTTYFDVIEAPKDLHVEYNKAANIVCKIDAYPPATITWFKDGKSFSGNPKIEMSSDKSVLTVKHMQLALQGKYVCEARNEFVRKVFRSNVVVVGLVKPLIHKGDEEIRVIRGKHAELSCRVIKGVPKPTIRWSFRHENKEKYTKLKVTSEVIHLKNVGTQHTGSYKCIANNVVGSDRFAMELIIEYPPKIKDTTNILRAKDGDEVTIPCNVDGVPIPTVKWSRNGTRVENTPRTRISSNHSLKFRATIADTGHYSCEAENALGIDKKIVFVEIFVPVMIDNPKVSTIETMVGKNVVLPCHADGYPKPEVKWTFHGSDPKSHKNITPSDGSTTVKLRNVQLDQQGNYTCVASHDISGSAYITYEVQVYAPPIIENVYPSKTFEVVEGDLGLSIQCKVTGSPKPTIMWKKDYDNIAFGTEWYDMSEDGTLFIKNIDSKSQGTYACVAQNILGNDTEIFDVVVKPPIPSGSIATVYVEEGKSVDLKCDIPHKKTDLLRWYKDGVELSRGELTLFEVTRSHEGYYSCRVSDFTRSRAATTEVKVAFKPTFISEEKEKLEFAEGSLALLICEAVGVPAPKVAWKHNGKEIKITDMTYPLEMTLRERGIYECDVYNEFGNIHRTFNITSRDCILHIKNDFSNKQPLMVSPSLTWPTFEVTDGFMIIPHAEYFFLNCPSLYSTLTSSTNVMAFCEGDTNVKINGKIYNFADIECREEIKPEIVKTGTPCLPGNNEYLKIGYQLYTEFIHVYDVCFNKDENVTLFAKHRLSPDHTNAVKESRWFSNDLLSFDFDAMYDCKNQEDNIASSLRRHLTMRDSCCFGRRQLVNFRDLRPGIPVTASFNYFNVVPHWSTCNSKNWEDVERRVRNLAKLAGRDLTITTGTAKPTHRPSSSDINLRDGRGGNQPVAQYLWKVVQDPPSSASLAIIQVNIPELTTSEASKYVLCRDICGIIDWMKNPNWYNVGDGFTYCCTITDFEIAFGYDGRFSPGMNHVLFDTTLIPEYYLIV